MLAWKCIMSSDVVFLRMFIRKHSKESFSYKVFNIKGKSYYQ